MTPSATPEIPPVDPSLFPPVRGAVDEGEEGELAPLPASFAELPTRLREPAFEALADDVSAQFQETLPGARVEGVDCSAVPCLLHLSAPTALGGEPAPLATAVGIATDLAEGDRPVIVTGESEGRATAAVTFTPPERTELGRAFEAAARVRTRTR
ncbi:MAG: hypothetical protein KDA24_29775 [Deltaproteobacteria bacterium]|nr:hypothetical protein [Deltaproteobacteria bacterium]